MIVGNADAHGKNFSVLYQPGAVTLAPFYDLLSTVAYPVWSPNLAMRIAKRATLEEIGPATWPAFAEDIGLATPFVRLRVAELADAVLAQSASICDSPAFAKSDVTAVRRPRAGFPGGDDNSQDTEAEGKFPLQSPT